MKTCYATRIIYVSAIPLVFLSSAVSARTIPANQYLIWGIGHDQINIPSGSIITEAVLTIGGVSSLQTGFKIHLLDDTSKGRYIGTDTSGQNFFAGYGAALNGAFINGSYVCRSSQSNDPLSPIWSKFTSPCRITLPDTSSVQLTSSTLLLNDYAGNCRGFGIGLDPGGMSFTYRYMILTLTLKSYQGTSKTSTISFINS